MRGRFIFWPDTPHQLIVPNNVLDEGEDTFLKMITQADVADVAAGGNFFVGLCGNTFDETTTLATLTGEPSAAGGYARQAIARNNVGWPTISVVNGIRRAQSLTVTFAAVGANFSTTFQRAFLCNVVSGTVGKLFAVSGALPAAIQVNDGQNFPMRYELYLR